MLHFLSNSPSLCILSLQTFLFCLIPPLSVVSSQLVHPDGTCTLREYTNRDIACVTDNFALDLESGKHFANFNINA